MPAMQRLAKFASLTLVASAALATATCTPEIPHTTISWTERRAVLPNGMKVVVMPDTSTQLVQVDVLYEVGANEDPAGKAGLAHLVEHMMFQHRPLGPDKPPTFQIIPQVATFFNAFTSWDMTHYMFQVPKEDVETALRIEAYRMNAGCNTIPPEQFDREREVVRNELRTNATDASFLIPAILGEALYPPGHPYSHTVGGDDRQLANIVFQDTCDFMQKYYTPSRATLLIAGNIEEATASKLIAATFGGIKDRPASSRVEVKPIELKAKTIEKTLDIERPILLVAWKLPSVTDPDYDNVNALFNGIGRIDELARKYDDCIRGVNVFPFGGGLAGTMAIALELCSNDHFDEALKWVWKGAATGGWGLKNAELDDDTKVVIKGFFISSMESIIARTLWMAEFIQFQTNRYKIDQPRQILFDELDRMDKLTADGYASFARRTFQQDKAVVIKIKASDKGQKGDVRAKLEFKAKSHNEPLKPLVDPADANRPEPAPKAKSVLSSAERYKLSNGMEVVLLPTESPLPLVRTRLVFRSGAAHEPVDKVGLANMAASMLAPELDADFMKTGVWVSGEASDDGTTFTSGGLNMYTDVIVKALERVVKVGTYDQERLERRQKELKQRLDSEQYREEQAFTQQLYAALFGEDHPYTVKGTATLASIGSLGYDNVSSFKRQHYEAKNATLVVVGAFDLSAIKPMIADSFGDWDGGSADQPVGPATATRTAPIFRGVVMSRVPQQMEVQIGYPSPAGADGQTAARLVMAEMLNDRLFEIRTELGSTYGTYARKTSFIGPNAYMMGGGVDVARAGESLKAMREKVDGLRRGVDFEVGFVNARRAVMKDLVGVSSEPTQLAARLGRIALMGLAPTYYDQLTARVATVTPAEVKALIAQELKPELEVVIAKADRETLIKAFQEAGLAGATLLDPK
jgi:zinc protease